MDNLVYFNVQQGHKPHNVDLLCVYLPDSYVKNEDEFYSALEYVIPKCDTLPDGIIIFHGEQLNPELMKAWENHQEKNKIFNRLTRLDTLYTKMFYFVKMTPLGFVINQELSFANGLFKPTLKDIKDLYLLGIESLAKKNDVIHYAPAGHNFRHPSGTILKLFIQAKEIAYNEAELQYVGRGICLLESDFDWKNIQKVFIDSMGIYSLVKEAVSFSGSSAMIENFHSYDGLPMLTIPSESEVVIISASTSGSMAGKLIEKGFKPEKILTLIDTSIRTTITKTLLVLDKSLTPSKKDSENHTHETEIELVGEQFTFKAKPPKQITIGIQHRPSDLNDILKTFGLNGVNRLNESLISINKSPLISLKADNLLECDNFNKWLDEEITWTLPSSIKTIIYKDDGASLKLAERVKSKILQIRGIGNEVSIIEASTLNSDKLRNCTGVLIVSAFCGDGGELRQISRDLREFEETIIPRHFLIGVGIPQSMSAWDKLRMFLVRNSTKRLYEFSVWKVLPLGPDVISSSWTDLSVFSARVEVMSDVVHPNLKDTEIELLLDALANVIQRSSNSLLPNNLGDSLELTAGFVFFNGLFENDLDNLEQSVVMMTISSVLQAAREHSNKDICLSPSNYQSVVLSPENFLRFNDDILQACLLRASLPSELDYSSNADLSNLMSEFLYKVFARYNHSFGFSALEFAAALAIGKLKLRKEHLTDLISSVLDENSSNKGALAGFMLAIRNEQNLH